VGLVFALFIRTDIDVSVRPVRNPTFITQSDGTIRNAYDLSLRNMTGADRQFQLGLTSDGILLLSVEGSPDNTVVVAANELRQVRVYVDADPTQDAAQRHQSDLRFWVVDPTNGQQTYLDSYFSGAGQSDDEDDD
jgi:polyferredoxin